MDEGQKLIKGGLKTMAKYYDVYYQKKFNPYREVMLHEVLDPDEYVFVMRLVENCYNTEGPEMAHLEFVYAQMQGECWSPEGEAREMIKALGLKHTSMSVGDVVHNVVDDKWYLVAMAGFKELGPAPAKTL